MCNTFTAFASHSLVASGPLSDVLAQMMAYLDGGSPEQVLVFRDDTGQQVDFDLRGTIEEVLARLAPEPPPRRPGRPKLGVVAREITLLPRHWEWLEQQPQGSSAALRRLVEAARKREPDVEKARLFREGLSRIMWSVAGNLPNFEESTRALFAKQDRELLGLIENWPQDVRGYIRERLEYVSRLESQNAESNA